MIRVCVAVWKKVSGRKQLHLLNNERYAENKLKSFLKAKTSIVSPSAYA